MCKPTCPHVDWGYTVDEIIAAVNAADENIKHGIQTDGITPRMRVVANFHTQKQHPIAYLIDQYQQNEQNMTLNKSLIAMILLWEFIKADIVHIDSDKTAKHMDYFVDCLQTVTQRIAEQHTVFHELLCNWDICRLSVDRDKLGPTKDQFMNLLYAMVQHRNDPAVYANPYLFRIFVVLLRDCIETAEDLYRKAKAAGCRYYNKHKALQERPRIDWVRSYDKVHDILIAYMFCDESLLRKKCDNNEYSCTQECHIDDQC